MTATTVEITRPRSDKTEYKRIVLQKVLLICDPETDKCAACVDVGAGAFSDPKGLCPFPCFTNI